MEAVDANGKNTGRHSVKRTARGPEEPPRTDRFEQEVTVQLEEPGEAPQPAEDTMQAIIREDRETQDQLLKDLRPWLLGYLAHLATLLAVFLVLARGGRDNNRDTILLLGLTYYAVFFCYQLASLGVPPRSKAKMTLTGLELLETASKILGLLLIENRLIYICFVGFFFLALLVTVLRAMAIKKSYEDLVKYQIVVEA